MKKTDLEKYSELNEEFIRECDRVVSIIKNMPEYENDIEFADRFIIDGNTVDWEGDEYWSRGGHEYHSGCFPAEYLTMDDYELKALVNEKVTEYINAKMERSKKRAEEEKEARRAEYEKLKKEFEG